MNPTLTEDTHENSSKVIDLVFDGQNVSDKRLDGNQEHLEDHFHSENGTEKSQVTCDFCGAASYWLQDLM